MHKIIYTGILSLILMASMVFSDNRAYSQTLPPNSLPLTGPSGAQSETIIPNSLISFTISNPYCYQPDFRVNKCSINFRFVQASDNQSSAPYMTWLAITIDNKKRFNATAFFEGTITYTYDMVPSGLIVDCGSPNAGGAGNDYGNVYAVMIQPLDSSRNPMSTDIANVTCPAYNP